MAHLKKNSHLLKTTSGHLAKACSPPPTGCAVECVVDPNPHCCPNIAEGVYDDTPNAYRVTIISATQSAKCSSDTASPFGVEKIDGSGLAGTTATLPLISSEDGHCIYQSDWIDVTSKVKILRCIGDGSPGCNCTPSTNVTTQSLMRVSMVAGGPPTFEFTVCKSTNNPDNYGPCPGAPVSGSDTSKDFATTCCEPFTFSAPGPDGSEAYLAIFITSGSVTPCLA